MKTQVYGLLAETSIHPGTGQDAGLIDQPVSREATTDIPVVVGSALKGALRDKLFWQRYQDPAADAGFESLSEPDQASKRQELREAADRDIVPIFGKTDDAGGILVSDARLLVLPVRSLTSSYYWVTCPLLVERARRDCERAGLDVDALNLPAALPEIAEMSYLGLANADSDPIYLEERQFSRQGPLPGGVADFMKTFIRHATTRARMATQLVILADNDFTWFARYGLPVSARNQLDRVKKTSGNLWYEETIPTDALFYCLIGERNEGTLAHFHEAFINPPYLQVGGNETVGQGWLTIQSVDSLPSAEPKAAGQPEAVAG